jgi:hypothetical protein
MPTPSALSRPQRSEETDAATEDVISASWIDLDEGELMRLEEYPAEVEEDNS